MDGLNYNTDIANCCAQYYISFLLGGPSTAGEALSDPCRAAFPWAVQSPIIGQIAPAWDINQPRSLLYFSRLFTLQAAEDDYCPMFCACPVLTRLPRLERQRSLACLEFGL